MSPELSSRLEDRVRAWNIEFDRTMETPTAVLAFGHRGGLPVVLKIIKSGAEEWRSGSVLDAFAGRGVVRVYEHVHGALLMEHLRPGESLVNKALHGSDDQATAALARVILAMAPRTAAAGVPTVEDWGRAFDRDEASGEMQVSEELVSDARRVYADLCRSQRRVRLLHGDLHHENVLFDAGRRWTAIDPKGVIGEVEYEVGAALRNPFEAPELFIAPAIIQRRVTLFARELNVDPTRVLAWAFAQAVLAALWAVEDGAHVDHDHAWIRLASTIRPMLESFVRLS